jgi:hypothetical protein
MAEEMIVFVAGLVLGLMAGIVLGWCAVPREVVWRAPKEAPEAGRAPDAVGMNGGL